MTATPAVQGPRLAVDIELKRAPFQLKVHLIAGSEIVVLFGPSGAGKTTLLNAIAGLAIPDAGEITFDGHIFFRKHRPGPNINLPARKRSIGYVFQDYALFPHLTAVENVAYSMWRQPDSASRAKALLDRLGIAHLGNRYPHELSGGQKQRVAISRALALDPQLLLLDEPFSALDISLRERLHNDLHALQRDSGLVMLCVTHNLEDAFALGHRLAVIQDGRLEQIGPVEEVFRSPANRRVATTIGIHNLFQARVVDSTSTGIILDWEGLSLEAPFHPVQRDDVVTAYIRPDDVKLLYPNMPLSTAVATNLATGKVISRDPTSTSHNLRVLLENGYEMRLRFPSYSYSSLSLTPGIDVRLCLRKGGLVILAPEEMKPKG